MTTSQSRTGRGPTPRPASGGRDGRSRRRLPFWAEVPILVVVAVALLVVIQGFVARIYVVPSASMETTLNGCPGCDNDRVLVDKVTQNFADPVAGDVIVFRGPPSWTDNPQGTVDDPADPTFFERLVALSSLSTPGEEDFVKRVIATGGQTVACCDANRVTVDGVPVSEPYLYVQPGSPAEQEAFGPVTLAPGQLWMMGDNRNNSADSRDHGPVSVDDIRGQVRAIVYPLPRVGLFSGQAPVPAG